MSNRVMTQEQKDKMKAAREAKKAAKAANPQAADETKAEAFRRLALKRVPRALKHLEMLANLAGAAYESTPEHRSKILSAIEEKLAVVRNAFDKKAPEKAVFTL